MEKKNKNYYPYCSVPMCKKDPKQACFSLPKEPALAKAWLECIGGGESKRQTYVCEKHFDKDSIIKYTARTQLARRTVPTLNLPCAKSKSNINPIITPRSHNNDLLTNVIINSLMPSVSKINKTMSIEPTSATFDHQEASSSNSDKRKHDNNSEGDGKITKKLKINPNKIETSFKEPDYTTKTIVELQKEIEDISKLSDVREELALNIYLTYPQAYEMLHNSLRLPSVSVLKDMFKSCAISTDDNTIFANILQLKVNMMTEREKNCVVCLGQTNVKPNLYYDIKSDKLLGIVDINDIQKPERANLALVLTVQGLFADWKQPIATAYVGTPENADLSIKQWIEKNISNLLKIGFNVRAFVSETEYIELPYQQYFEISNNKIYFIYDVPTLFKLFYYNFLTYEYGFESRIAKMKHLLHLYKLDIKKELRLSPKLTEMHMKHTKLQDINIMQVEEVLSLETAAAMSTYIDCGAMGKSAKSTVQLITKMNTLFEVLHSKSFSVSVREASGKIESTKKFLRAMIQFFNNFKFIDCITKEVVPKEQGSFAKNINHTIKSVLLLYADLRKSNDSESLPTRRLSLDNLRSFFDQVKKLENNSELPSCKFINLAFRQSLLLNVLKPINNVKYVNLYTALDQIKNLISGFKSNRPKIAYLNCNREIKISCSEYNTLDLQKRDAVVLMAGFLLKKCFDRHGDCAAMKNYICIVLHDTSSLCKMILNEIQSGICVVPQESFIEFVEMMEIKFRSFMTKDILETQNGKLIQGLMTTMQQVNFAMPCSCFPILYAKKLYVRLRMYSTLKHNNKIYTTPEKCKTIFVNNL